MTTSVCIHPCTHKHNTQSNRFTGQGRGEKGEGEKGEGEKGEGEKGEGENGYLPMRQNLLRVRQLTQYIENTFYTCP
jgi:hypothetical protein